MADLANIVKLMNIKVNNTTFNSKISGKKRRYWLTSEENDKYINKVETTAQSQNRYQSNNGTTTGQQRDSKQGNNKIITRQQQDNNKATTKPQPDNNRDNKQKNNEITIKQQLDENINEETIFLIQTLVGTQKKLFNYIFSLCLERDEINTGHISTANLANVVNCSYGTTKTTLSRLEKKGLIKRLKGKGCRGGFVNFEIPKNIKIFVLQIKKESVINMDNNEATTRQQRGNNRDNEQDNAYYSSSSYLLNTTTTNTTQRSIEPQLLSEWQNLNLEPLSKIGFTTTHLSQIAEQNKLQPQAIQDSIYAFAFDLQENDKAKSIKGDLINFFMGILRNGRVYTFPSNYESPQDRAMRLYTEQTRAADQKRKALEKEAVDLAFNDWFSQLNEAQKIEFLPKNLQNTKILLGKNKMIESAAKSHFEAEIWPDKKQEITKSARNPEQELQNQDQIPINIKQEVPNVENN